MNRRSFAGFASSLGIGAVLQPIGAMAQLVSKNADQLNNGEFNWHPERSASGPLLIIVSVPDQLVHVYRNGIRVAASTCSTGKPGHGTPTGVFTVLQKDKNHHSSTYNNAPMPNMNRLTWSGVALHAGNLPGYPASHGCVRLPLKFSEMLFGITKLGMTVVIADNSSQPNSVVHPGMVLGDYARREFTGVNAALTKSTYSEGQRPQPISTSVVVSGRDKTIQVMENGRIVAKGSVTIDNHKIPLGNKVYSLTAHDKAAQDLRWSGVGYGKGDREGLANELHRIKAEPRVREEVRQRMQHGMTIVTTHESVTEAHRTPGDFVVIDGFY